MSDIVDYAGRDLEAMAWAVNYHRWILQVFTPYLGSRVVEVGAGKGSFSELLLERRPHSLSLVEPSAAMHAQLVERLKPLSTSTEVVTYQTTFEHAADRIRVTQHPDSIIYVNVLEHIADDQTELTTISRTLKKGGRVFIFVPALSWLFGSFDKRIGHYRRYTRSELAAKCASAGLKVILANYFDFIGVAPWWIKYRLLKSDQLETTAVKFYDDYVVPLAKAIESAVSPPIGKNVILIAENVSTSTGD
jgi:SAM-dependent methyltransferase